VNPRRRRIARQRHQDRRATAAALSGTVRDRDQLARVERWALPLLAKRRVFVRSVRAFFTFDPTSRA
jgi:hypothetical protein